MNVTVETTPESDANFHVELDWPTIDKASEKVYRRLAQTQKIPGFRSGHAPRAMIERLVGGPDALYEEAIADLVEDAIRASAKEHELTLLAAPHTHVHEIHVGEPHEVTVTLPVLGRGELADYHDLHFAPEPVTVTEEDVDEIVERTRASNIQEVPANRPAQIGDRVTMDLKLTVGEKVINDLKDHQFDLVDDRSGIFTGLDQEIVGMSEGESKEFTLTLPEDYAKAELAGQPANYVVTLTNVAVKELPPVDDDLAQKVGKYANVEEMRAAIRRELLQERETAARRNVRNQLTDALIERLTLAIPSVLVDAEVEDLLNDLGHMLSREAIDMDKYLRAMGQDPDEYRKNMRPEAVRRIQQRRVLELVAEREGIIVTSADVQRVLDSYNLGVPSARRLRLSTLKPSQKLTIERSILRDRAQDWLMKNLTDEESSATIDGTSDSTSDEAAPEAALPSPAEAIEAPAAVTSDAPAGVTEAPNA